MADPQHPGAEARNWLAAIVNSSDDVIISKNLDGVILSWNRAAERLFGYTPEQAIGKHICLIVPSDRMDEEYGLLDRVRTGESVDHFETVRRARDGRLVDVSLTVSPIVGDDGTIVGISKIGRDITATKTAERAAAHLAAIVESSEDAIVSKRLDGVITSWNKSAERIFGYTPAEAIGSHVTMLIPHEHMDEESLIIGKIKAGQPVEHFETVRRARDGRLVDVSLTVSPIRDETGTIVGASKIARDITDQKRIQAMAAEAGQRRDEFVTNMSHELRTPMNAIIGLSHILAMSDAMTPRDRKSVDMLRASADGLMKLINDLLDFAKIDQGDIDVETYEFNLATTVSDTVDLLQVKAREKNLTMAFGYDGALGDLYMGDAFRLRQILTNLIGNAVKFTEHGRVDVEVHAGGTPEAPRVQIEVRDTGIGIAADKQAIVFEKFVQGDATLTRKYGGTGLGLAIARSLTERLGGEITLVSTPGAGSAFTVSLPLAKSARNAPQAEPASGPRGRKNVLIVDDYDANVMVLSTLAEDLGYDFDIARNGLDGVRLALETDYDVILMDVQMPGLDGYEATRRIRRAETGSGVTVPIIGVTAHVRPADRQKCLDAGMTDFIPKPFDPAQVERFLAELIAEPRGSRTEARPASVIPLRFPRG